MVENKNSDSVSPTSKSIKTYYAGLENHFAVLTDNQFVGINSKNKRLLVSEHISTANPCSTSVGTFKSQITNLAFSKPLSFLLVGTENGHLRQYSFSYGKLQIQADYGDLGIGPIGSSSLLGHVLVVGSGETNKIKFVDVRDQVIDNTCVDTAVKSTSTLQFCLTQKSVFVGVGGDKPDYSQSRSDLFDVSGFYDRGALLPLSNDQSSPEKVEGVGFRTN